MTRLGLYFNLNSLDTLPGLSWKCFLKMRAATVLFIQMCSGRLEVSITKLYCYREGWLSNLRVNTFESRDDLIQSVLTSCYLPLMQSASAGWFRDSMCIDGVFQPFPSL